MSSLQLDCSVVWYLTQLMLVINSVLMLVSHTIVTDSIIICLRSNTLLVSVTITTSGSTTAGENFILNCSVNGSSATFQWLERTETPVTNGNSRTITTSSSSSQLHFTPLHESHGGTYTCNTTIAKITESKSVVLSVNGIVSKSLYLINI